MPGTRFTINPGKTKKPLTETARGTADRRVRRQMGLRGFLHVGSC
jgi:hypothetical protein